MIKIALITSRELSNLFGGEALPIPALKALMCDVCICVWNDPMIVWANYDGIVIRCSWDYYEKLTKFTAWLDVLDGSKVKVNNDIATMRWNLNNKYLVDLAQNSYTVIPTQLLPTTDTRNLSALLESMACDAIIIKPIQSAGAWRTLRVNQQNTHRFLRSFFLSFCVDCPLIMHCTQVNFS